MTPELAALLADLADDRLTPDGERRLAELLKADPAARAAYLEQIELAADLHWQYGVAALVGVGQDESHPETHKAKADGKSPNASFRMFRRYPVLTALAGLAACVAVAVVALRRPTPDAAAVVVRSDRADLGIGDRVPAGGVVRLAAGTAVLRFACGADLTLSGPTEVEAESGLAAVLRAGRVVVRADGPASGFRVRTPAADFIDLGTEFGVIVGSDGAAEAHVFEGVVVARPLASEQVVPLRHRDTVRVEPQAGDVIAVESDGARFRVGAAAAPTAAPPRTAYPPLPAGARVVFLGDGMTDRETHIQLALAALRDVPVASRPLLFNLGESVPGRFTEDDIEGGLRPFRPTHAVLEFGPEAAAYPDGRTVEEFAADIDRLLDRLRDEGIEPLVHLGHPLAAGHPAQPKLDGYNRVLRTAAEARGLRAADPGPWFRAAPDLLAPDGLSLTFAGHRVVAATVLELLGYAGRPIENTLRPALLPGVVRDWKIRVRPGGRPVTDEVAAALTPDDTWQAVTVPQPADPLTRRLSDPTHSTWYWNQLQGYVRTSMRGGDALEAVGIVSAVRDRDAVLNVGGQLSRVWLNGERVFEKSRYIGLHAGTARVPVRLRAGPNRLVVEARWTFFVSVTDAADWPLPVPE